MFPEPRIPRALFLLLCCLLFTAGEEAVRLSKLEGNSVTIHPGLTGVQSDDQILWFFGPEKADIKIVNSQVFRGETIIDYNRDRFRDRLQLNRSSGSLTIRNISREDSGVYQLQIITGKNSVWSFSVKVYAPVSKPVIRNQTGSLSGNHRESCSPECSVENGEDVSLSWYKEEERISSISGANSSDCLHLPLNRTFSTTSTYTCVSANPVSNQTAQLSITELCTFIKGETEQSLTFWPIIVGLVGFLIIILGLFVFFGKKIRKQKVSKDAELNYAEVNFSPQKQKEYQNSKQVDSDDSVLYSAITK